MCRGTWDGGSVKENASVGIFSLALGLATLFFIPQLVSGEGLAAVGDANSPAFFPIVIAVLLVVCGASVIIGLMIGRSPPVTGEGEIESPLRIGATAGFVVVYAILISWIGMLASSVICIAGLAYILGYRRHGIILSAAIIVPGLVYVLFERMLYVLLPESQIF